MEPKLSTSFHPQTDGQTERINSVLNQYLQIYCNFLQDSWVQLLPLAEFAYNNSVHSATMVTPFMANYGINPGTVLSKSTLLTDVPNKLSERMKSIDDSYIVIWRAPNNKPQRPTIRNFRTAEWQRRYDCT